MDVPWRAGRQCEQLGTRKRGESLNFRLCYTDEASFKIKKKSKCSLFPVSDSNRSRVVCLTETSPRRRPRKWKKPRLSRARVGSFAYSEPGRHYQSCPAATEKEEREGTNGWKKLPSPNSLSLSFPESPSCAIGRPFAPWPGLSPLNFSLLAATLTVLLFDLGFDGMKFHEML